MATSILNFRASLVYLKSWDLITFPEAAVRPAVRIRFWSFPCFSTSLLFETPPLSVSIFAICIVISFVASLVLVPAVRSLAHRLGLVDRPDSERKLHAEPVALGGGLAVFLALMVAFVSTVLLDHALFGVSLGDVASNWLTLLAAAGAMLLVGLLDDIWTLRGRQKLLLQCLIIVGLVGSGTVIRAIDIFGVSFEFGVFAFPLSVIWLLVAVNALNLIDGADGMATTAGCIICLGLGFLGWQTESNLSAVVGFALAGALAGFFVFNRPPATIYLGDAGSMMIGLVVGVLAVWSNFKESTVLASAPIAILAIPLFDSTVAILRRWLTGRSIYTSDRAHLHHLLEQKYGSGLMLMVVAVLCGMTTSVAVLSHWFDTPWLAGVGVAIVVGLLIVTRSFGYAECSLLVGRAANLAQSFTSNPHTRYRNHRRFPLQGVASWDTVWEPLVEFAKNHDLVRVKIDLNLAWLHEGYHANWQSVELPDKSSQLTIGVPLFARRSSDDRQLQIGRLEIISPANDPSVYDRMADLSDQLVDLAPEIDRIVAKLEAAQQSTGVDREMASTRQDAFHDPSMAPAAESIPPKSTMTATEAR